MRCQDNGFRKGFEFMVGQRFANPGAKQNLGRIKIRTMIIVILDIIIKNINDRNDVHAIKYF